MSAKKCSVPGCINGKPKRHRFPKSDPAIFRQWLVKIDSAKLFSMDNETIYRLCRVCDKHFTRDCIVVGTKRGLKRTAVPTLYLPASRSASCEIIPQPGTSSEGYEIDVPSSIPTLMDHDYIAYESPKTATKSVANTSPIVHKTGSAASRSASSDIIPQPGTSSEDYEIDVPSSVPTLMDHDYIAYESPKTATKSVANTSPIVYKTGSAGGRPYTSILKQVGVTRQVDLTPKAKHMYKRIINMSAKICNSQRRITSYQQRLAAAEKFSARHHMPEIMEKVNDHTYRFISCQIRNQTLLPKARRYTLEEKILALTFFKSSGRAYKLLSKIFALPTRGTLTKLLNRLPFTAGVNENLFKTLQRSVRKMSPKEKYCSLIFDEISLSTNLQYNIKYDCIDGVVDDGNYRCASLADHANVFMIKGIFKYWKQPIVFTFSNGPVKSINLKNNIKEVIAACQNIGLQVICTICDQGATNQAAINYLLKESTIESHGFFVNDKEIIPLYDIPHLFKGIRNNLLTKDLHYYKAEKKCIAKWEHLIKFYHLDIQEENRICSKLTDEHIIPGKINKMKVKNCTQVFSYQVGSLLEKIAKWGISDIPQEALDTSSFILFMDKLFDSCNSHTKMASKSKPIKGSLKMNSDHETFWLQSIDVLRTMKFYDEKNKKFVIVPSIKNLIFTLQGFINLKKKVLSKLPNAYICLRDLNQDCLENFFSLIRSHGIRNTNPSVCHFQKSFKSLIINNFMASHSPHSNCEDDKSEGSLSNFKSFLLGETEHDVSVISELNNENIQILPPSLLTRKTKISRCILRYISGYLVRKLKKHTSCPICLHVISGNVSDEDIDFIIARSYEQSCLQIPSKLFTYTVAQMLSHIFYALPRVCNSKNISLVLHNTIKNIHTKSLCCNQHPEFAKKITQLTIKCCIYFWCRKVNLIATGKDTKFQKALQKVSDLKLVDPIKLMALNKFTKKQNRYRKLRK